MKISIEGFWISKFMVEALPMKETSRTDYNLGDLLYEFPAKPRLTVYRRLDTYSSWWGAREIGHGYIAPLYEFPERKSG